MNIIDIANFSLVYLVHYSLTIDGAYSHLPWGQHLAIFISIGSDRGPTGLKVFDGYFVIVQKSRLTKNIRVMKEVRGTKLELKV